MSRSLRIPPPLLALPLLAAALAASLFGAAAPPAEAAPVVSHGQGVLWLADHTSWLGNYQLGDGLFGYCIDVEKPVPGGTAVDYVDGSTAGGFARDDAARLAFISDRWGSPPDPITAAAAQLATWSITGLGGHDLAYFAQRANGDADTVLRTAQSMLQTIDGPRGASRGVRATVGLDVRGAGGRVQTDLVVDYLAGSAAPPAGSHVGTLTLHGATFLDGSQVKLVRNGFDEHILPDQGGSTESVRADVEYGGLPYGPTFRLGRNTSGAQSLLVQVPFPTEARASTEESGPNELPFRPLVETQTSAAVTQPGALLTDALTLRVHPGSGTGAEWGVYQQGDGSLHPIPVVIESVLRGPFPSPPVEADEVPEGSPVACTVAITARRGAGRYESPPCRVPSAGYYVWTDSIDPKRTPPEHGGDRLVGWTSRFGVASETTLVPAAPEIATRASDAELPSPGCVSDRLTVKGLPAGIAPLPVTSTLLGPLAEAPPEGSTPPGWQNFPVAGTVVTPITRNGPVDSPCIDITLPGFYYFTTTAPASDGTTPLPTAPSPDDTLLPATPSPDDTTLLAATPSPNGTTLPPTTPSPDGAVLLPATPARVLIPAFSDTRVLAAESVRLLAPPPPPSPTPTPTPSSTPPAPTTTPTPPPSAAAAPPSPAPNRLALTGRTPSPTPMTIAALASAVIAGLACLGLALRRRP